MTHIGAAKKTAKLEGEMNTLFLRGTGVTFALYRWTLRRRIVARLHSDLLCTLLRNEDLGKLR